ncbi:MAG: hypothetical protein GX640_18485 [Fibrobacter sp.]|nr:hypothetical protein [Fibrobacter sp.]
MQIGECDPRCIAPTNKLPSLTPEQAQAHTWIPDSITWASIKEHSVSSPVKIVIIGYPDSNSQEILSSGQVSIQTSCDSFKKIVDSRPDNAEAHRNLGHAMAERGDLQHASKHLELAVRFSYEKDPLAMYLLGRVYADLGKFKRAVEIDLKAIFIANQMNNQVLADAIRGHLHQLSQYQ